MDGVCLPVEDTGDTDRDTDTDPLDGDDDGYPADEDCDDDDPAVHPGAQERCDPDDVDEDCDSLADDDDPDVAGTTTWYLDQDGDGHDGTGIEACDAPADHVLRRGALRQGPASTGPAPSCAILRQPEASAAGIDEVTPRSDP